MYCCAWNGMYRCLLIHYILLHVLNPFCKPSFATMSAFSLRSSPLFPGIYFESYVILFEQCIQFGTKVASNLSRVYLVQEDGLYDRLPAWQDIFCLLLISCSRLLISHSLMHEWLGLLFRFYVWSHTRLRDQGSSWCKKKFTYGSCLLY